MAKKVPTANKTPVRGDRAKAGHERPRPDEAAQVQGRRGQPRAVQSDQAAAQQGARGKAPKPVEGDGSAKHMTDKVADAALTILWIGVGEDRRSPGSRRQRAARPRRGAAQLRRTVQAFLDAGGNPATLQNSARLGIAKLQP